MRVGDLVTGKYQVMRFGVNFVPVENAFGFVLSVDERSRTVQVLYDNSVYVYFLSELRVVSDVAGVK
jgi:hypothetical protein